MRVWTAVRRAAPAALLVLTACAGPAGTDPTHPAFPEDPAFDYQLGGAYPPPEGTAVVVRDAAADPAPGLFNVCYVNGFQTQPGERADWLAHRPELVLHDPAGDPVADENWPDELLLDTSTAQRRDRIAEVVGETVRGCARAGFDAVELDNLDSYLRSGGALTMADNLALATALIRIAHDSGLSVGQKNTADLGVRGRDEAGFDFAVVEECRRWDECDAYREAYGGRVIDIEYTDDWPEPAQACAGDGPATILRDRALVPAGEPGHFYRHC
ncbi:endo alpha-1,4 polygalactosaminidase [Actinophytocola xanthii]|uniref:Glycoside-hydrolase family GH114 TIM-barrel domain-containing protein n=1 Tax=Actinophytocola xanthii TaxID=1912961 RepID=A0A1Q8CU33_9PSEU|nr:endo alpha-1,4 polygalactosaminidase [Actinophytocola xanthii]OLF17871.1 hypothetical protein BU204_08645 [Actinophytocola xanthii]